MVSCAAELCGKKQLAVGRQMLCLDCARRHSQSFPIILICGFRSVAKTGERKNLIVVGQNISLTCAHNWWILVCTCFHSRGSALTLVVTLVHKF